MLRLKQQIPNSRSQERPRREETRSGKGYPQGEVDEVRVWIGRCCGLAVKKKRDGGQGQDRNEGSIFFAQAPIEAAVQRLTQLFS
jgi:hypothetical protein